MKSLLVILSLSFAAPGLHAEVMAQAGSSSAAQSAPVKRGDAFEKCLIENANADLNRIEQSGAEVKREMILLAAKSAFQKCIPAALSDTLSLQEAQEIRLRVFGYLDHYWINTRGS